MMTFRELKATTSFTRDVEESETSNKCNEYLNASYVSSGAGDEDGGGAFGQKWMMLPLFNGLIIALERGDEKGIHSMFMLK